MNHPHILLATLDQYPVIQNMARFYVYDASRVCGLTSKDWAIPSDGLYESSDLKNYFKEQDRKAYLVKIRDELAGFVLLNQVGTLAETEWNMGQFFILARFQGQGVGKKVAHSV